MRRKAKKEGLGQANGEDETGIVERLYEKYSAVVFNEIPEREGYTFKCWEEVSPKYNEITDEKTRIPENTEEDDVAQFEKNDEYVITKDISLKAIWEKK